MTFADPAAVLATGAFHAPNLSELEAAGERAVRDNINSRGSLVTGGEAKQQFIRKWLREKDIERNEKELEQVMREKQGFDYARRAPQVWPRTRIIGRTTPAILFLSSSVAASIFRSGGMKITQRVASLPSVYKLSA
jgi:hypothetical protein